MDDINFVWISAVSLLIGAGSLLLMPYVLIQLPADYFANSARRSQRLMFLHPVLRMTLRIIKNLFGVLFILLGLILLVLPGQGILTLLVGIVLVDFPGKFQLERRLLSWPVVLPLINGIRIKAGKAPFTLI